MEKGNILHLSQEEIRAEMEMYKGALPYDISFLFRCRLEKLRNKNGFTIKEVCKKIGCSEKSYNLWKCGDRNKCPNKVFFPVPSMDKLLKICELYDVSLDYLLGRTDFTSCDNEMISNKTGLSDKAIQGLKSLQIHDKQTNVALQLTYQFTGHIYRKFTSLGMSVINCFLENIEQFKPFIFGFIGYCLPSAFSVPVVKKADSDTWEQVDKIALASDTERLDDCETIEIDTITQKAIAKNKMDIVLNDFVEIYQKSRLKKVE